MGVPSAYYCGFPCPADAHVTGGRNCVPGVLQSTATANGKYTRGDFIKLFRMKAWKEPESAIRDIGYDAMKDRRNSSELCWMPFSSGPSKHTPGYVSPVVSMVDHCHGVFVREYCHICYCNIIQCQGKLSSHCTYVIAPPPPAFSGKICFSALDPNTRRSAKQ